MSDDLKLSPYADRGAHVVYPVTVDHEGVTGVVSVTFTDFGNVSVNTEAHVNDDWAALTYRGADFLCHVNAKMTPGGDFEEGNYASTATRRVNWGDATKTQTRKIKAAMLKAAREAWISHPDAVTAGERRQARFALESAERDLEDLAPKVKAARAAKRAALKRLSDPDAS